MRNRVMVSIVVLTAGCSPGPDTSTFTYTGRLSIDSGTEYAALEVPSSIGGACDGWNTVEIRNPGMPGTGMTNVVCWKRNGDDITITDRIGTQQQSGPASNWSD